MCASVAFISIYCSLIVYTLWKFANFSTGCNITFSGFISLGDIYIVLTSSVYWACCSFGPGHLQAQLKLNLVHSLNTHIFHNFKLGFISIIIINSAKLSPSVSGPVTIGFFFKDFPSEQSSTIPLSLHLCRTTIHFRRKKSILCTSKTKHFKVKFALLSRAQ